MSEAPSFASFANLILVSSCLGFVFLVLLLVLRISARLARIERLLSKLKNSPEEQEMAPSIAETSAGGAFESFLAEDPARREMTKSEQFTAYRQWRDQRGLNWSGPTDNR